MQPWRPPAKGGARLETALRSELRFTRADYDALPEDLRVELIDGQLLKMPSATLRHQKIATAIAASIHALRKILRIHFLMPRPLA